MCPMSTLTVAGRPSYHEDLLGTALDPGDIMLCAVIMD